jgi:TetR/AcrR family transcriptional regulator, cholesterol catabolism regulator
MMADGPEPVVERTDTRRSTQIRRAAAVLFFDHGYEATTTRAIARQLGIKSASIYYHYEDKEEILFEIIHSTMEDLLEGARVGVAKEAEPDRQLAAVVVCHVLMHAYRPKETILGDTELRSLTGQRRQRVQALRDAYERLVVGVLSAGRAAGTFDVLDDKLTAYAVLAQCTNVGVWYDRKGRMGLDEIAFVYVNFALRMVGAPQLDHDAGAEILARAHALQGERVAGLPAWVEGPRE